MNTRIIATALTIATMLTLVACNKDDNDSMNNSDREFMERMAYTHNGEVEFGNLAASKGSDASVKAYGQMMASQHSTARNELQGLADQRNYKIPTNPDLEHVALKVALNNAFGREFDSIYITGQVKDHVQELVIIADEIGKGKDQALKKYAGKHKPAADSHKSTAEAIVTSMGF